MQLVELKNGETYNGHMVQCDTWMNIHLREVICTSKVRAALGCGREDAGLSAAWLCHGGGAGRQAIRFSTGPAFP